MKELEDWRKANGLTNTEIADRLGAANSQNYTNWRRRGSLPQEYHARAAGLMGKEYIGAAPEPDRNDFAGLLKNIPASDFIEVAAELGRLMPAADRVRLAASLLDGLADDI